MECQEHELVIYNLTIHRHRCPEHGEAEHIHNGFRWWCLLCHPEARPAGRAS